MKKKIINGIMMVALVASAGSCYLNIIRFL